MFRMGIDLEERDVQLQMGRGKLSIGEPDARHVLHYPFYADRPGRLKSWGDLSGSARLSIGECTIDYAVSLDHEFSIKDMVEEPYLAFVTAKSPSSISNLQKCKTITAAIPPVILQESKQCQAVGETSGSHPT